MLKDKSVSWGLTEMPAFSTGNYLVTPDAVWNYTLGSFITPEPNLALMHLDIPNVEEEINERIIPPDLPKRLSRAFAVLTPDRQFYKGRDCAQERTQVIAELFGIAPVHLFEEEVALAEFTFN